jgi:ABC-type multidrug transport system ATPase subunit
MKQKLALSCALIHAPRLIVLDEPTTGVDAVSRSEFWEMLQNLKKENITIIVSTPYMDEADRCDRVALIQDGSILKVDKPSRIPGNYGSKLFAVSADKRYMLIQALRDHDLVESVNAFGDSVHITYIEDRIDNDLALYLEGAGLGKVQIEEIQPGIEDTFLKLIKNNGVR